LEDPLYGRITGVRFRVLAYPSNDLLMNFVLPIPPVFRRSENYFTDVVISPATEGEIPCRQPVLAEFTWHSDELGEKIAYGYPVADSGSFPYSYKPYSYGGLAGPTGFASVYFHLTEPTPRHITGIRLVLRRKSDMATVAEETFPLDLWCMPPDPRFTGVACPAGTDVHVHARIVPCTTWRIESGDDLQTWPDVSDWMFCPDGYLDNLDVDALLPGGRRFYRIQTHEDVDRPNN
jgi:hypothetical protein